MVNKKFLLFAGLCAALATQPASAQESQTSSASWGSRDMTYRGENYDVLDSSYYSGKRLDQYRRYMNYQTAFPPRPNNMWEVGINFGGANVFGDVTSKTPFTAKEFMDAVGFGFTVRKSLGYFLSMRFQYLNARASGFEYRVHSPNEAPWNQYYAPGTAGGALNPNGIFQNYQTKVNEATLQLVGAINNIRFHKGKNMMSVYGLAGVGIFHYVPKVDALDANGNPHDFSGVRQDAQWGDGRKDVNDQIKNILDGDYESDALQENVKGNKKLNPVLTMGLGVQFRLSDRVTLQFEDKVSLTGKDLLDGSQLTTTGELTPDKDLFNYASLGLNFNLGNKRKNVAPLWWVNPLDHGYNELSTPRHMRLPDPVLPDSDNDGITDQFDRCPGTPAGVAVDAHGCPMDTDGDGVPDYKDKELITPTYCQPVDADGVGKCPCPDGCGTASACANIGAGSLNFSGSSSKITPAMQSQLSNLAAQMSANPTCKVVIIGAGNKSKVQQQRSWDRVNAVIEYMSEKHGIDRGRFIFQYGAPGGENSVMYRSANTGEEGPSNVAPPFPNLRRD